MTFIIHGLYKGNKVMKGYYTAVGYIGWFHGRYVLFATEQDYEEAFIEDAILNS